jgi:hypothetical protein
MIEDRTGRQKAMLCYETNLSDDRFVCSSNWLRRTLFFYNSTRLIGVAEAEDG